MLELKLFILLLLVYKANAQFRRLPPVRNIKLPSQSDMSNQEISSSPEFLIVYPENQSHEIHSELEYAAQPPGYLTLKPTITPDEKDDSEAKTLYFPELYFDPRTASELTGKLETSFDFVPKENLVAEDEVIPINESGYVAEPQLDFESDAATDPEISPQPELESLTYRPVVIPRYISKPVPETELKPTPNLGPKSETESELLPEKKLGDEHEIETKPISESKPEQQLEPEPEPRSKPKYESEPELKPELETEPKPKLQLKPELEPEFNTEAEAEHESKSEVEPKSEPELVAELEPEHDLQSELEPTPEYKHKPEPELGSKHESELIPERRSESVLIPEPKYEPELESTPESDLIPKPKYEPEFESKPELEPVLKPEYVPETEVKLKPKHESAPKLEPRSESESVPKPEYEPEIEFNSELQPKPESEPKLEPKLESESVAEPKYIPDPKPDLESKPNSEIEIEPALKPEVKHEQETIPPNYDSEEYTELPTFRPRPPFSDYSSPRPPPSLTPESDRPPEDFVCRRENAYYAIPYQCNTFIECQRFVAKKYICPDDFLFNHKADWPEYPCHYASAVECTVPEPAKESESEADVHSESEVDVNNSIPELEPETSETPINQPNGSDKTLEDPELTTFRPRPPFTNYSTSSPRPEYTHPTSENIPSTTLRPQEDVQCKEENAYYAISHECDTFIECQKYIGKKYVCPDGLLFNPKANWPEFPCSYPSEINCVNKTIIQEPKPTGECPRRFGTFPSNTGDCGKYIVCDDGRALAMECPKGLAFNPEISACDWPESVPSCSPKAFEDFKCPEPPRELYGRLSEKVYNYRYKNSCKEYIACSKGEPRLLRCDPGLSFDEISGRCIDSRAVPTCESYLL